MNETIDIKTKKIISQSIKQGFDKAEVHEALGKNIVSHWDTWGKFQQVWNNKAYRTFKDFDKYIVLIYLIQDYMQQSADKFEYSSIQEFYSQEKLVINKINIIKISSELDVPKETIRRKVNELQNEDILIREGKKIILNKNATDFQKPQASLDAMASLLEKKSNNLHSEKWFGSSLKKEEVKSYIEKYFTIIWLRFLRLQIPFLTRHRAVFGDLETWMIWGNVAVHHQKNLAKVVDESLISGNLGSDEIKLTNYYHSVTNTNVPRGINASSISDITSIPRATVIRKLKWLVKQNVLKKNIQLEYHMNCKGKMNKKIENNFKINQIFLAEFLTDFFDYYKNSNFKP